LLLTLIYIMKIVPHVLLCSLFFLTLSACSSTANKADRNVNFDNTSAEAGALNDDYVGMTVSEAQIKAKAEGVPFRITMADGEAFAVTMDYRVGRINAVVEKGIVMSYNIEGQAESVVPEKTMFDQNSWKTMISASCSSFFDGCNNCNRMEGTDAAACTRMFCDQYQKPVCLDDQAMNPDEVTAPSRGKKVAYQCDQGLEFLVSYDEYVSGDSIMKLQPEQIMFSDTQTRTATVMNRTVAASGEKYESEEGLIFWSKGTTAQVMQGEENLYENCEEI
jgi:membrane-bound inhibitor of C-type lysozyme